ncbi:hypothetical protein SAMN04487765_1626 [Tenacibaculum sp. MAR_2010_89]|uniref:hypothetical protein n=1 Tax=Tenacibaculum sp. MAR_2010_89 TaxID=1250198 RepID=UPI000896001F|nr:hypothetical protein [Tenacibaculum sp. MAR_2010_89]SEE16750.1 hypothetical protein SAMN04487765_1626 [Tenacibaculum sp. MAR_2010_89]
MRALKKYKLKLKKTDCNYIHIISDSKEIQILAQYLDLWNNSKDIKEDLLPEIDSVINGELEFNDIGADVVGVAYIEQATTKLLGSDVGYSDFELPTSDFKELIIEWLAILESTDR